MEAPQHIRVERDGAGSTAETKNAYKVGTGKSDEPILLGLLVTAHYLCLFLRTGARVNDERRACREPWWRWLLGCWE